MIKEKTHRGKEKEESSEETLSGSLKNVRFEGLFGRKSLEEGEDGNGS
jgi:hypothetical protein